jgi:uncharacterized protein YndB with AHSA1/START domain
MNTNSFPPLHLQYKFAVSAETVFDAWVVPGIVKLWLFAGAGSEIIDVKIDAREGGKFSILELNNGKKIDHFGEYFEVERPTRLAFTLEVPEHFNGVSYVTVEIVKTTDGCELLFTQSGIDTSQTEKDWRNMLNTLSNLLAKKDHQAGEAFSA